MREIPAQQIIDTVADMCIKANRYLPADVKRAFDACAAAEDLPAAKEVFRQLKENYELAEETGLPLCQDTGLAVFFVDVGDDVRVTGMNLREAINEGVRKGYKDGFLRKSSCDPMTRKNVGDNTPAIVHFDMVPGDKLKISFM
ncbi:MAG: fumarate hydratase, partial [Desulfocurvibacter africanus]